MREVDVGGQGGENWIWRRILCLNRLGRSPTAARATPPVACKADQLPGRHHGLAARSRGGCIG
eukprot:8222299-Pyramimonas_sp.AAC.1